MSAAAATAAATAEHYGQRLLLLLQPPANTLRFWLEKSSDRDYYMEASGRDASRGRPPSRRYDSTFDDRNASR
jgi:hypothetical protein